ncbi:uncharacterized protein LOC108623602, partial [Ceratina calcarata]|uniref:Uncharacterized protein LOC108623602 n=1 Tax=Ceratina calcarata TaxID=156304 RepID=A0AAJ7N5D4_9HYME
MSKKEVQLSSLYDKIESYLRALETLGVATDKCAAMLFPLVESSLPEELLRVWQRSNSTNDFNESVSSSDASKTRLTKLIKFLELEVQNELRISMAVKGFNLRDQSETERSKKTKPQTTGKDIPSARSLINKGREVVCIFCQKSDHDSAKCTQAKTMSLAERQEVVKRKRACFNCLKIGHNRRFCRVYLKCTKCARRHVDIMCREESRSDTQSEKPQNSLSAVNIQKECSLAISCNVPSTFMQTLKVKLRNDSSEVIVRAVIDTGSQNSYIIKEMAERLKYEPVGKQDLVHLLFGGEKTNITTHNRYLIRVGSLDDTYRCNFQALEEDLICADVPSVTKGVWLQELDEINVKLTDVCSEEKTVAILIGADVAGKLFTGRIHVLDSGLTAMETRLGWTLMGKVPTIKGDINLAATTISMYAKEADIKDLWDLDVLGIRDPIECKTQKQHNEHVEKMFIDAVTKNTEGRYEVRLPWLECYPEFKDNKMLALRQLETMTKKLRAAGRYEDYDGVFKDWLKEGIIERVPPEQESRQGNYIPHRPIFKENSTTTTRPIYNASVEGKGLPSLNSCLEKGPNLIELVAAILLRFREGCLGVIADIRRAFVQISIHPAERDFLRFFWYDDEGKVIVYRHCRVVFGVCSSPFILGAIINLHLSSVLNSFSGNSITEIVYNNTKKLKRSFYVDNCVTSVNSVDELNVFMNNAKTVMESGKFDLRGWEYTKDGGAKGFSNVLGLLWDKELDTLSLNIANLEKLVFEKLTKRDILSVAHRIFDPLGFVCPIALGPKILLQEAWAAKLSWDEEVSDDIQKRFMQWINELRNINQIKIPRCMIGMVDETDEISLHVFVDASELAYATVIFIRIQREDDVQVYFVQAITRVAPAVKNSSTVVTWIQRENNWSVFVSNRVKEIRQLTDYRQWRHIPGHRNPADLPSRGCTVHQLLTSKWWEGPDWLKENKEKWPAAQVLSIDETEVNSELKKSTLVQNTTLLSVKTKDITVEKDTDEYCNANIKLMKMIQGKHFDTLDDERIKAYAPFMDDQGLIRSKSKLLYREDMKLDKLVHIPRRYRSIEAVHLELVSSLNVATFLMALQRHISRRGRPSVIYSDNGTNFVGLNNQLSTLDYEKIAKTVAIQQIEWKFNPPSAPWWGGFWERLIGVLKRLLRRTLKKTCLSFEEMMTTLIDCEAVINSRPITFLSDSQEEIMPLTPSMFLHEVREIGVLDLEKIEKVKLNKRFSYRQKIKHDLGQRFRNEYLGALKHQKCKGENFKNLKVGDIVLIDNDNAKRLDWPLAKIKQLFLGKDGYVRVARLITASGEITLPVQRLYPLELNADCNSENEVRMVCEK